MRSQPHDFLVAQAAIGLRLAAPIDARRIVVALLRAIGVRTARPRARRITFALHGVAPRSGLRGRATTVGPYRHEKKRRRPGRAAPTPRFAGCSNHRQRRAQREDAAGGHVTAGRLFKHCSNAGARSFAEGGSVGLPMTELPKRLQSMPDSPTLSHTNSARPRMLS
jgi:hypothetical protein